MLSRNDTGKLLPWLYFVLRGLDGPVVSGRWPWLADHMENRQECGYITTVLQWKSGPGARSNVRLQRGSSTEKGHGARIRPGI
jgi:hypothetical protein